MNKKDPFEYNSIEDYYTFFRIEYEQIAKKSTPLSALTILYQSKQILKDELKSLQDFFAQEIPEIFKDEYANFEDITTIRSNQQILSSSEIKILKSNTYEENLHAFKELIRPCLRENLTVDDSFLKQLFYDDLENVDLNQRIETLEAVISKAIRMNHPLVLDKHLSQEELNQISSKTNLGRPLDKSLPQSTVNRIVQKCSENKEFLHSNGSLKPTTVRDHLLSHPETRNTLGESAMYDRVKKAQEELNIP